MTELIPLGRGLFAMVDSEDLEKVSRHKWHYSNTGYAVWRGMENGKKITLRMHRLIMDAPRGLVVDHLNHNTLDNRRANLRVCTQAENNRNRLSRGYCWDKSKGLWLVVHKGRFYGRYKTEMEAKKAAALAKSGSPKQDRQHPRRKYLPRGVYYMLSESKKQHPPYYIRPQINGQRVFQGYFSTVAEAERAYKTTIAATGGMTS